MTSGDCHSFEATLGVAEINNPWTPGTGAASPIGGIVVDPFATLMLSIDCSLPITRCRRKL